MSVSNLEEKDSLIFLKDNFFFKNRTIHFHVNGIRVIRPVKRKKLSFSSIEINKPLPASVYGAL